MLRVFWLPIAHEVPKATSRLGAHVAAGAESVQQRAIIHRQDAETRRCHIGVFNELLYVVKKLLSVGHDGKIFGKIQLCNWIFPTGLVSCGTLKRAA